MISALTINIQCHLATNQSADRFLASLEMTGESVNGRVKFIESQSENNEESLKHISPIVIPSVAEESITDMESGKNDAIVSHRRE